MIRLFAGLVVCASMLAASGQEGDSNNAPQPKILVGERGGSVQSAVVDFSEIAAQPKGKKSAGPRKLHHRLSNPLLGSRSKPPTDEASGEMKAQSFVAAAAALSPTTLTNFLGAPDNGNFIPPDTDGAVGPRHIVVMVNGEFRVLSRSGQLISSVTLDQFWARLNNIETFDPHILFDATVGRWITVTCADPESPSSSVLIGMSKTDDPTGAWNLYKVDADSTNRDWADYPAIGYNGKWVAVNLNMFGNSTDIFDGARMWVFDKNSLLTGAAQVNFKTFDEASGFTMSPCVTYDPNEPTLHIVETFSGNSLRLSTITGPVGGESLNVGTATVNSTVSWNPFGGMLGAQQGSSQPIDCGDTRILNAVFRNGSIWAAHTIFFPATGVPTHASAQWWQINPNGNALQRGLVDDPSGTASFAYPTIGVNNRNDCLIGYTKFSPTEFASAHYSFHASSDAPSSLQSDALLKAGEAPYFKDFGSGENRWGDYSATMVDPLNDIDLWTLQEYAATPVGGASQWGVWWGMISLSAPPDGILDLQVNPSTGSDVAAGAPTDFFVSVTDSFILINNATVTARIAGRSDIVFRNDGVSPDLVANDNVYSASITLNNSSESTVIFNATSPGKSPGSLTATYNVLPRPANDNFANALKVPPAGVAGLSIYEIPNNFATTEPSEPLHAGVSNARSLWWNYSTTNNGPILLDTSGTGPRVVVAVYTGTSLATLLPVASTNPPPNTEAILKFNATAGTTYRIAIAGFDSGEKGLVRLRVQPNGQPDITPPILTVDFPPSGLITNATSLTFSGTAVDPAPDPSGVNVVLLQHLEQAPEGVVQATLDGTHWTANVPLDPGTNTFLITTVDFADNTSEPKRIVIYQREQTATNDLFTFARKLAGNSGVDTLSNTEATKEFGEPLHAGNEGGKSLWWYFAPATNGIILLSTEGSSFDTLLGLYTLDDPAVAHSVSDLRPVASNDDAGGGTNGSSELAAAVQAGKIYYIAVDGYGGASGDIHLQYNFAAFGVFPLTTSVDTNGGGTISPANNTFPANSAVTVTATPDRYKQFQSFTVTINGVATTFTNNPYTFEITAPTDVVAHFGGKIFTDDFERPDLGRNYQNPSNNWRLETVITNQETLASTRVARSVEIGNSTSASLVLVTNLVPGVGSFEFHVSSETNFDKAQFLLDGRVLATWSGEIPWRIFTFDVPLKTGNSYQLEWRYTKDFAGAEGSDAFFIDNLDLPIAPPAPIVLSISANPPTITANGPPLADLQLQSTADLNNPNGWAPADEKTTSSSGTAVFTLPAFTGTQVFYRVIRL